MISNFPVSIFQLSIWNSRWHSIQLNDSEPVTQGLSQCDSKISSIRINIKFFGQIEITKKCRHFCFLNIRILNWAQFFNAVGKFFRLVNLSCNHFKFYSQLDASVVCASYKGGLCRFQIQFLQGWLSQKSPQSRMRVVFNKLFSFRQSNMLQ